MKSISNEIVEFFLKCLDIRRYSEKTQAKVEYSLQVIVGELLKLLGLCIVFMFLGKVQAFFIALLTIAPLRIFIGGLHMKTKIGCFSFSLVFFLSITFISKYMIGNEIVFDFIVMLLCFVIWKVAPLPSPRLIEYSAFAKMRFKANALTVCILEMMVYRYMNNATQSVMVAALTWCCIEVMVCGIMSGRRK